MCLVDIDEDLEQGSFFGELLELVRIGRNGVLVAAVAFVGAILESDFHVPQVFG